MLFADIVGSSALGESRDPEIMRAALGRTFDGVSEVIRDSVRLGGPAAQG